MSSTVIIFNTLLPPLPHTVAFNADQIINCGLMCLLEVVLQEHHEDRSRAAAETAGIYCLSVCLSDNINVCVCICLSAAETAVSFWLTF